MTPLPIRRHPISRRSCRFRERDRATLWLAGSAAIGVLFAGGASGAVRPPRASQLELRTGAEYYARGWDNASGASTISEYLLPVDLAWRTPALRLSAGADFSRADADVAGEPKTPLSVGEFRGASEFNFWRDRLRLAAGVRVASSDVGLEPRQARVAELLDEVALGFPRAAHPGGSRLVLEAGGQPWRRTGYTVQMGTAWERRGSYELLSDGRRLDAGDPWRIAASITAGRGTLLGDFGLRWETSGRNTFDDGYSYQDGSLLTARAGLRRGLERGRLEVAGTIATRADGSMDAGAPMDAGWLGGGTAGRLVVSGVRSTTGAGEFGLSLGLFGVSGYPGDLGSALALEPGLSWTRALAAGRLELGLRGMYGHCSEDRRLRGLNASFSWRREWRP